LKIIGFSLPPAAAAFLAVALVAASTYAQAPPPAQGPAGAPPPGHFKMPNPTNLQVLPKDLTGDQVMEIMHGWEAQLGTECAHCHAADPTKLMPNGKPRLNFADDSKKEKKIARLMLHMTMDINKNYVSMVESSDQPVQQVKCGTCHRGHVKPELFVPKPEHDDHDHDDHDHPPAAAHPGTR